jgi:hypothetical protein
MTIAISLFLTSFVFVFLKAGQQLNVARGHYWLVPPFSFGMAATEVYVIAAVAVHGYSLHAVIGMGTGGSLGAIIAMYLHSRLLGSQT